MCNKRDLRKKQTWLDVEEKKLPKQQQKKLINMYKKEYNIYPDKYTKNLMFTYDVLFIKYLKNSKIKNRKRKELDKLVKYLNIIDRPFRKNRN